MVKMEEKKYAITLDDFSLAAVKNADSKASSLYEWWQSYEEPHVYTNKMFEMESISINNLLEMYYKLIKNPENESYRINPNLRTPKGIISFLKKKYKPYKKMVYVTAADGISDPRYIDAPDITAKELEKKLDNLLMIIKGPKPKIFGEEAIKEIKDYGPQNIIAFYHDFSMWKYPELQKSNELERQIQSIGFKITGRVSGKASRIRYSLEYKK